MSISHNNLTTQPLTSHEWLPEVSFDINLGRHFQHIGFDYDTYIGYQTDRGLDPQDVIATALHFSTKNEKFFDAYYSPIRRDIGFHGLQNSTNRRANQLIAHELQHKIDHDMGELTITDLAMTAGANVGRSIGKLGLWGAAGLGITAILNRSSFTGEVARLLAGSSLSAYILGRVLYRVNPFEKKAREVEAKNKAKFIYLLARTPDNLQA